MVLIRRRFRELPLGWFGIAAIIGGACWVFKGGSILATGNQPPLVFEAGQFFFLVGLLGVDRLLTAETRLRNFGRRWVYLGIASILLLGIHQLLFPTYLPESDELDLSSLPQVVTAIALIIGPLCLGWRTDQSKTIPGPWRMLPLILGVSMPLMIIIGGVLVGISDDERLLELPLVIYAFGWIVLGYLLLQISRSDGVDSLT